MSTNLLKQKSLELPDDYSSSDSDSTPNDDSSDGSVTSSTTKSDSSTDYDSESSVERKKLEKAESNVNRELKKKKNRVKKQEKHDEMKRRKKLAKTGQRPSFDKNKDYDENLKKMDDSKNYNQEDVEQLMGKQLDSVEEEEIVNNGDEEISDKKPEDQELRTEDMLVFTWTPLNDESYPERLKFEEQDSIEDFEVDNENQNIEEKQKTDFEKVDVEKSSIPTDVSDSSDYEKMDHVKLVESCVESENSQVVGAEIVGKESDVKILLDLCRFYNPFEKLSETSRIDENQDNSNNWKNEIKQLDDNAHDCKSEHQDVFGSRNQSSDYEEMDVVNSVESSVESENARVDEAQKDSDEKVLRNLSKSSNFEKLSGTSEIVESQNHDSNDWKKGMTQLDDSTYIDEFGQYVFDCTRYVLPDYTGVSDESEPQKVPESQNQSSDFEKIEDPIENGKSTFEEEKISIDAGSKRSKQKIKKNEEFAIGCPSLPKINDSHPLQDSEKSVENEIISVTPTVDPKLIHDCTGYSVQDVSSTIVSAENYKPFSQNTMRNTIINCRLAITLENPDSSLNQTWELSENASKMDVYRLHHLKTSVSKCKEELNWINEKFKENREVSLLLKEDLWMTVINLMAEYRLLNTTLPMENYEEEESYLESYQSPDYFSMNFDFSMDLTNEKNDSYKIPENYLIPTVTFENVWKIASEPEQNQLYHLKSSISKEQSILRTVSKNSAASNQEFEKFIFIKHERALLKNLAKLKILIHTIQMENEIKEIIEIQPIDHLNSEIDVFEDLENVTISSTGTAAEAENEREDYENEETYVLRDYNVTPPSIDSLPLEVQENLRLLNSTSDVERSHIPSLTIYIEPELSTFKKIGIGMVEMVDLRENCRISETSRFWDAAPVFIPFITLFQIMLYNSFTANNTYNNKLHELHKEVFSLSNQKTINLVSNLYSQCLFGIPLEVAFGTKNIAVLYGFGSMFPLITFLGFSPHSVPPGGFAVYSLVFLQVAFLLKHWKRAACRWSQVLLIFLCIAVDFNLQTVSKSLLAAKVHAAITGLFFGLFYIHFPRTPNYRWINARFISCVVYFMYMLWIAQVCVVGMRKESRAS